MSLQFRATSDTRTRSASQPPCPPGSAGDATSSCCTPYESQRPHTCRNRHTKRCINDSELCWLFVYCIKSLTRCSLDHAITETLNHLGEGELERFLRTFLINLQKIHKHAMSKMPRSLTITIQLSNYREEKPVERTKFKMTCLP